MFSLLKSVWVLGALLIGVITLLGLMSQGNRRSRPVSRARSQSVAAATPAPSTSIVAVTETAQATPVPVRSRSVRRGVVPMTVALALGVMVVGANAGASIAASVTPTHVPNSGFRYLEQDPNDSGICVNGGGMFGGLESFGESSTGDVGGTPMNITNIHITDEDYWGIDFTVDSGFLVTKVLIMDGNDGGNLYEYPAGTTGDTLLTTPDPSLKSISHVEVCWVEETVEDDVIDPKGSIGGPCNDPAYYGIFDNTGSTVAIRFRYRWYTNYGLHAVHKTVPAGAIFRTWEKWAKPNTLVRIAYKDPTTNKWIQIASITAGKGNYPPCVYQRGFEFPNP